MVQLGDILDIEELAAEISAGYVTRRLNDDGTLAILNYSNSAQYDRHWTQVTKACRGLIYDTETLEVLARPFPKFFNYSEHDGELPSGRIIRMPKMDGSLGILYWDNQWGYRIATRGSMQSEQALWATAKFAEMMGGDAFGFEPIKGKTYLMEIIYRENKIVVDYGDSERLTLLDVIDNVTGVSDLEEFDNCAWPDKVERVDLSTLDPAEQATLIPQGEEGFVFYWPDTGLRLKLKAEEYVALHRIIFNLTPKNIWRAMVAGKTLAAIKEPFPDEFYDEIDGIYMEISDDYVDISNEVASAYLSIDPTLSQKDFAAKVKQYPRHIQGLLFSTRAGKTIHNAILRMVEPKGDSPRVAE